MAEMDEGEGTNFITQRTLVREALERVGPEPCVVDEGADLVSICEQLGDGPAVQTVAVVDKAGHLTGIIPLRLLLDELFLRVAPEEFLSDLRGMEGIEEFGRISRARTARDLMQPAVYVTMDDSVREAFSLMHERRLEGLPIVDGDMRVVGYLDRLQLIRLGLPKRRREGGV